ncbi:MAG: SUMF1/EgtB/PvdO family nonheme iron enzyme [Candidatus Omnitrophica bacterium]|nr:SUMF1/EgtB/PvdO family nonheme iron enzyme [Candidatus Omnitrophota bacterium]
MNKNEKKNISGFGDQDLEIRKLVDWAGDFAKCPDTPLSKYRYHNILIPLISFVIATILFTAQAQANNVAVSNPVITGQNAAAKTCKIQFAISWDNSWRNSLNYDAAWVFVKYSTDAGATWSHATLKTTGGGTDPIGFSEGTATVGGVSKLLNIVVPSDNKGAFIQISSAATGSGTLSATGLQFVWDWGSDKLSSDGVTAISSATSARVKVFAVEMVYIPLGTFSAGSGGAETSCFTKTMINTAGAATAPSGSPPYGGYPSGQTAPNASWPNGYSAFYAMKYELSQEQYVDFFNTLTSDQKTTRDITGGVLNVTGKADDAEVNRNTISWTSGDATAGANANVACNFLSWADLIAYADWAALRPFTELEFEKACRGIAAAVANEYAWGTATIAASVYTLANEGTAIEGIDTNYQTTLGNCIYNAAYSNPVRCGIFAAVTIGHATGKSFTGLHGDGSLNASGNANTVNWPGTDAVGSGFRGGGWGYDAPYGRVSDRNRATGIVADRCDDSGGRCARTP